MAAHPPLRFKLLPEHYAVAKCATIPGTRAAGSLFSVTCTDEEISVVCAESELPDACTHIERGWRALKIEGPLDFALVGVLASVTASLAQNNISLFALSTYNTDYILVREQSLKKAKAALQAAGHAIAG